MDYRFEFVVENITQEQIDHLWSIIIHYAESHGTVVAGGSGPAETGDTDDGETTQR